MKISLKKNDIILMIVILAAAGAVFFLRGKIGGSGAGYVTIKVNGVMEGVYSLDEDREIEINGGKNHLVIKDGKADMTAADCPDQLCVRQKAVSKNGESIICLPNRVVAEVESSKNSEWDAVTN